MNQKPTIGRIVHYQSFGTPEGEYKPAARAAIVTEVRTDGDAVSLAVFNPDGIFLAKWVAYNPEGKPGTWRWPPIDNGQPRYSPEVG